MYQRYSIKSFKIMLLDELPVFSLKGYNTGLSVSMHTSIVNFLTVRFSGVKLIYQHSTVALSVDVLNYDYFSITPPRFRFEA